MDILAEFFNRLPAKRRHTPSGWTNSNAVCCHHRGGHKPDKKQRGGFKALGDGGFVYNCHNCTFKASWSPGRILSKDAKKFLEYLGATPDEIKKINFQCLKLKNNSTVTKSSTISEIKSIALPPGSKTLQEWAASENPPEDFITVLRYMADRNGDLLDWATYYWTPDTKFSMNRRVIVPFVSESGWLNGYSARTVDPKIKPKFIAQLCNNGYLFNQDKLYSPNRKFVIIVEGILDAVSIDGVAVMKQFLSTGQIEVLKTCEKKIIIVPDCDHSGKQLVDQAIKLGYSVSMPNWMDSNIKDVADAVKKFGRLAVMKLILENVLDSELKIKLAMRKWFRDA